jgi:hypothetical protein
MIPARLSAITAAHIQALVDEEERERSDLDFKEKLPDRSDSAKEDFVADVCAFANARGGDIVYGIQDKKDETGQPSGVAGAIVGLARVNPDREMASLLQVLDQNIQPKLSGIDWVLVEGAADGPVIVLRIPRSFSNPHMSTFRGQQRFYTRTGAQKRFFDIEEIRSAFIASESMGERARDFRAKRLMAISSGETPIPLMQSGTRLIIHVLPISSASKSVTQIDPRISSDLLMPPAQGDRYGDSRFNLDGAVGYWSVGEVAASYLQVFRNSALEFVHAYCSGTAEEGLLLDERYIDESIRKSLERSLQIFRRFERDPPYVLMASLIGARGAIIHQQRWTRPGFQHRKHEQDDLLLPDIWIENHPVNFDDIVRPVMDVLWQACGHQRCPHYDEDGRRTFESR